MTDNNFLYPAEIKHILNYYFWQNALKLLKYQLELKRKGHNHFKKFSMFYYEKLKSMAVDIESESYFNQRVVSGLFYGLSNEFSIIPYNVPKWNGVGIRSYKFFSYPLRILYYAIGLYIAKLSQEYLSEYIANTIRLNLSCLTCITRFLSEQSKIIKQERRNDIRRETGKAAFECSAIG